jgi:hypothetical protein
VKSKLLVALATIFCECLAGCKAGKAVGQIVEIRYTSSAGAILPELQWHEEIVITRGGVSLKRNGRAPDSEVNEGTWDIAVDAQQVSALLEQLQAVDCSTIERVEPEDAPDGGGEESYTIVYASGIKCTLWYNAGVTYTNGERIVEPVQTFLQSLAYPVEAKSRYNLPLP